MKYIYLGFLVLITLNASAQNNPVAQNKPVNYDLLNKRLDSLVTENKIINERLQNYASTSDKIVNQIYWVFGIILTAILGLTIWNNIAAYRIGNSRIKSIEERLATENTATIEAYLKENLDKKIKSNYSGLEGKILGLQGSILSIEIELLKRSITVTDMVSFHHVEDHNLVDLLEKSLTMYEASTMEHDLKDTLAAIAIYLKKYPNLTNYSRDKFIAGISKVKGVEFKHYVDEIKELLNLK